jgi:ATP-dependent helicase/DNAse subunit B
LFNVIDYKSGRVVRKNADDPIDGTALQLELYTLAAQQVVLGGQALPVGGGYWSIQENGFKQILSMCDLSGQEPQLYPGWERRRDEVTKRVFELVQGVRRGEFPVFSRDDTCTGYCPYHTVCRVNQVRSLEKAWPPSIVGAS